MTTIVEILPYIGRAVLGGMFVVGGIGHFLQFDVVVQELIRRNFPLPGPSLIVASVFQIIAGSALALGYFQTLSALGLIVFTLVASIIVHDFWRKEGQARVMAMLWWQSNAGIIGGLLALS